MNDFWMGFVLGALSVFVLALAIGAWLTLAMGEPPFNPDDQEW